jgi:hypothetical protein
MAITMRVMEIMVIVECMVAEVVVSETDAKLKLKSIKKPRYKSRFFD